MVGREEPPSLCAAITCFAEPFRSRALLEEIEAQGGPGEFRLEAFEDPSAKATSAEFKTLFDSHGVPLKTRGEWGCMQGVADFAFQEVEADWILYLPDDVLPTPGYFEWVARWMRTLPPEVGGLQTPYVNFCDLFPEKPNNAMYAPNRSWLREVKWNPHWYGPCMYLNMNGAGFAIRKDVYRKVGPLDLRTWCLDEWLSWKLMTETEYVVMCVPGPPTVHQGGASTIAQHALGLAHKRHSTIDGWMDAIGKPKDECAEILRGIMHERAAKYGFHVR